MRNKITITPVQNIPKNSFVQEILIPKKGVDSPLCMYCDEVDDILHFFFKCSEVTFFWESVARWLYRVTGIKLEGPVEGILFNFSEMSNTNRIINFILLTVKCYIYRQRLFHGGRLDVMEWAMEFKKKLIVEN